MIWRWFHHGDIISGQVDLHMTQGSISLPDITLRKIVSVTTLGLAQVAT